MSDDELIERIAEAINQRMSWKSLHWGDLHEDAYPHLARAALAVARPIIRNEVLDEATRMLMDQRGVNQPEYTEHSCGAWCALGVAVRNVRSLRSDSKGDSDATDL